MQLGQLDQGPLLQLSLKGAARDLHRPPVACSGNGWPTWAGIGPQGRSCRLAFCGAPERRYAGTVAASGSE